MTKWVVDIEDVLGKRLSVLTQLRNDPVLLSAFKQHYKTHPADFINDWGMTFDPRNVELDLNPVMPFVLWPRQREFVEWIHTKFKAGQRGLAEKSRDGGATWLCVGWAVCMFLFHDGFTAGFGSRKQDLVDKKGDPKCIFEKVRFFIDKLPNVFKPEGYDSREHATFLRVTNPQNDSTITGEAGDDIGRGARMSAYFVDEAAFIEHQESVDAALSQTTNCQIDLSTANGNGNEFFKKRHGGKINVFTMFWKDDPRKDQAWYEKQQEEQSAVTVASEIDIDYNASMEDIFLPAQWVEACVDAHIKLGIEPTGADIVSFDPADTGDAKARGYRKGVVFLQADQKKSGDITQAMPWAFELAEEVKADVFVYDADGMGAPSMKLYLNRATKGKKMNVVSFYGSGRIWDPNKKYKDGKRNKDKFVNRRAQAWMNVRDRMELTYEAVINKKYVDPDEIISISSKCKELFQLKSELSRPLRIYNNAGKIGVESKQNMASRSVDSPNLADQLIYSYDFGSVPEIDVKSEVKIPNQVTAFSHG